MSEISTKQNNSFNIRVASITLPYSTSICIDPMTCLGQVKAMRSKSQALCLAGQSVFSVPLLWFAPLVVGLAQELTQVGQKWIVLKTDWKSLETVFLF